MKYIIAILSVLLVLTVAFSGCMQSTKSNTATAPSANNGGNSQANQQQNTGTNTTLNITNSTATDLNDTTETGYVNEESPF